MIFPDLDKALAALMACVRGAPGPDKDLGTASLEEPDWHRFVDLALRHQLAPLAYYELYTAAPDAVPAWVMEVLGAAYHKALATNVVMYDRLQRILKAFRQQGVQVLLLKGALFAQTLYPSIGTRPMCDVDLVIPPEQLAEAEAVLYGLGYGPPYTGSRSREYQVRYGGELAYSQSRAWPTVDLHWHVLFGEWLRRTTLVQGEDFWGRAQPVTFDGMTVQQLATADSLLYQVVHAGLTHRFTIMGLRNFVDLDRTIRAAGDSLDWPGFVALARRVRLATATYLMLELCSELLGTPVPPAVLQSLRPSAVRRWCLARLLDREAIIEIRYTPRRGYLLQWLLIDRPVDMIRLLWRTFFPESEWLAVRYAVHDRWSLFFHRLRHPIRVLRLRGAI